MFVKSILHQIKISIPKLNVRQIVFKISFSCEYINELSTYHTHVWHALSYVILNIYHMWTVKYRTIDFVTPVTQAAEKETYLNQYS